jgi:hypothetical protein
MHLFFNHKNTIIVNAQTTTDCTLALLAADNLLNVQCVAV